MSTEQEKWNGIAVSAQQAVDNMREFQKHMQKIADAWQSSAAKAVIDRMTPPEPQWKPGQVVRATARGEKNIILMRVEEPGGFRYWTAGRPVGLLNDTADKAFDDEVTDIEPVAVLTAEDAGDWVEAAGEYRWMSLEDTIRVQNFILGLFRDRGLDVD